MDAIAYDTETTGLNRHDGAEMFSYSTCTADWKTDVRRLDGKAPSTPKAARFRLEQLWGERGRQRWSKVMHNSRFDIGMTQDYLGRSLRGHDTHETMALSHLFQNTHPTHALDQLAWELFGYPKDQDRLIDKYKHSEYGLRDCPPELLPPYQVADAERTMGLFAFWYPKMIANGWQEIYDMERRLAWTTLALHDRGIMIDVARCRQLQEWCRDEAQRAREDFQAIVGEMVNPNSSKQLQYILFEKMGFPVLKRTKTGQPSTDADTLQRLQEMNDHPILDAILRHRAYGGGETALMNYEFHAGSDNVIHTNIHPYKDRTSREASSQPNLQNVGKAKAIRARYPIPAREAFVPKPGFVNFHIDYSGIEWRLAVHGSGDERMKQMIRDGDDSHAVGAAIFFGEQWRQAHPKDRKPMRDVMKNANYRMIYGGGNIKGMAATLGLPESRVAAKLPEYKEHYRGVMDLVSRYSEDVRGRGYIETEFGRRLHVSRSKPYKGANYWDQGTAAGILKRAQNRVDQYLIDGTGGEAGIILPVHDELIIEWPRDRIEEAPACLREIREMMIDFPQITVPLEVDVEVSERNWRELKDFDIGLEAA
jgi:DNA polymerase-1